MNKCECGCGKEVTNSDNRFIVGHNTRKRQYIPCDVCGKLFRPYNDNSKYCSMKCYNTVKGLDRKKRKEFVCQKCGKTFEYKTYRTPKYCSKECWSSRNPPTEKTCIKCGNKFTPRDKKAMYCSRSCSRKDKTGEMATNWKGGKSSQTTRGKLSGNLKKWRETIYKRDNYTCQKCGKRGGQLQAHHIKPLAQFPEYALSVDNGITVCVACHEIIHNKKLGHRKSSY